MASSSDAIEPSSDALLATPPDNYIAGDKIHAIACASSSDDIEFDPDWIMATPPDNSIAADKAYAILHDLDVCSGGIPNVTKQKRRLSAKQSTFSDNDVFESS
eukprot:8850296-Heterocapsa_arctica.AAC.1